MKQIEGLGTFVLVVLTLVLSGAFLSPSAQTDRTAHVHFAGTSEHTASQQLLFMTDAGARQYPSDEHRGRTILVRKFKPRATAPTRIIDGLHVHSSAPAVDGDDLSAFVSILNTVGTIRTILPAAELKLVHTMKEQKIFSAFTNDVCRNLTA